MKKSISLFALLSFITLQGFAKGPVSLRDVPSLITETYMIAIVFIVGFLLLAMLISTMIKYEGGTHPKDPGKRKMWFWIVGILAPITFFLYNFLAVIPNVARGPAASKFSMHPLIATGIVLVAYVLLGFILSKLMKRGKIGNWF